MRYSLGEIVEKFKIPVEMEEEALKNNNNDLTIQEYLQVIEKALSKNQQMKNQSEEIYLRHIKNLQKECKSLQNQTLQYEMENKNLSSTVEILTNEQFQQNLVDLTKELELKNNEIFQLKFELDKQNSENENELLKIKKVISD